MPEQDQTSSRADGAGSRQVRAWTEQGQDKANKSADGTGTRQGKQEHGPSKPAVPVGTRPSKIVDQTGSTARKRADGTETGTGKQEREPYRDKTRRDVGRTVQGTRPDEQERGPCRT